MNFSHRYRTTLVVVFCATIFSILFITPAPAYAEAGLTTPICDILKKMLPEIRTYQPAGARAQFVMELSEQLDYDASKVKQFKTEADASAEKSCPKEREEMLGVLKIKSLANSLD